MPAAGASQRELIAPMFVSAEPLSASRRRTVSAWAEPPPTDDNGEEVMLNIGAQRVSRSRKR